MTISTEVKRVLQNGTGSTAVFSFNAPVDNVDDLVVYTYVPSTGVQSTQTRGGSGTYDYAVAINSSTKFATITLNTVLPATFAEPISSGIICCVFSVFLFLFILSLIYQVFKFKRHRPKNYLNIFKFNNYTGVLLFLSIFFINL